MAGFAPIRALFAGALPRLVLFDLDGTLIDSVPDIARAVNRVLARHGCAEVAESAVRGWVGRGSRRLLADALQSVDPHGRRDQAGLDRLLADYLAGYHADCTARTRLMPGAAELLGALAAAGVTQACVTNKPGAITDEVLRHFDLQRFFARAQGGDAGAGLKPAPGPLLRLAAELGCEPAATLMIGDSRHDVDAARAAGMPVICVAGGYNHGEDIRLARPDAVVADLHSLL